MLLKSEYRRILSRARTMLAARPATQLHVILHRDAISDPLTIAAKVNDFLGGHLDVARMAAVVDPLLHRRHARDVNGESNLILAN